jgi:hypothetical protein
VERIHFFFFFFYFALQFKKGGGTEVGITVDPVKIESISEFGTPKQVAKRVLDTEVPFFLFFPSVFFVGKADDFFQKNFIPKQVAKRVLDTEVLHVFPSFLGAGGEEEEIVFIFLHSQAFRFTRPHTRFLQFSPFFFIAPGL